MSRRDIADWRRTVYRSAVIGDPVRVLLLYLADHMRADRSVSVPRKTIATALGKSERRVSERFSAAHEAGFLTTVSPGYRGHVPVYRGLFPDAERATPTSTLSESERETPTSTLSGAETRTLSTRKRVTPGGPTTTTADLSARGDRRDVGSDERVEDQPVRSRPTVCEFHPWQTCPEDCRNYDRAAS